MVILLDQFHLPESVFDIIFATEQQAIVAKLLVDEMKQNDGMMGKSEMSLFANTLHDGTEVEVIKGEGLTKKKIKEKISYNKRQFYDRILTPMKSMGLVDYDMYKKHYLLSDRFQKVLIKVGLMWNHELQK